MKALRFCHVLYVLQSLYMVNCYKVRPSLYDPVELVHFQLLDGSENVNRNRYDVIPPYTLSPSRPALPLLSRGERETGFDEYLDGTAEPSCRELRKMWRLARKIHNKVNIHYTEINFNELGLYVWCTVQVNTYINLEFLNPKNPDVVDLL